MPFTPSTKVHLCTVPFDKENNHVIRFGNSADQFSYFSGKIIRTLENYTYQRRDNVIKANINIDVLENINYIFYNNLNFTNKWFYAFVTKLEYISENVTNIHIETDVWQTWAFDVTFKQSFIVREHVTTDTKGLHTVEEGLELGEYVFNGNPVNAGINEIGFIMGLVNEPVTPFNPIVGNAGTGIFQGVGYFFYRNNTAGVNTLTTHISALDTAGKGSSILFISTISKELINPDVLSIANGGRLGSSNLLDYYTQVDKRATISKPSTIVWNADSFTPKNNKLLTHPFTLLMASNRAGGTKNYRYEWFNSVNCQFGLRSTLDASPIALSLPIDYRGTTHIEPNNREVGNPSYQLYDVEDGLSMKGYPQCSWNSDVYKNWLAQNSVSLGVNFAGSALAIIGGLATGNMMATASGILGIAGQMGQLSQHEIINADGKGTMSNGSANVALGYQDFVYYRVNIRPEIARKIDNYFEQFGYKVNELKIPNLTGRPIWNYVQLIDPNITGDIPSNDMQLLKSYFTRGITLWHTTTGFLDYSLNNH